MRAARMQWRHRTRTHGSSRWQYEDQGGIKGATIILFQECVHQRAEVMFVWLTTTRF